MIMLGIVIEKWRKWDFFFFFTLIRSRGSINSIWFFYFASVNYQNVSFSLQMWPHLWIRSQPMTKRADYKLPIKKLKIKEKNLNWRENSDTLHSWTISVKKVWNKNTSVGTKKLNWWQRAEKNGILENKVREKQLGRAKYAWKQKPIAYKLENHKNMETVVIPIQKEPFKLTK